MLESVEFFVPGIAIPKGSMKHIGRGRMVDQQGSRLTNWMSNIVSIATKTPRPPGYNTVYLEYWLPQINYMQKGYDVDKLDRAVLDALTGIFWINDSLVISKYSKKLCASHSDPGLFCNVSYTDPAQLQVRGFKAHSEAK